MLFEENRLNDNFYAVNSMNTKKMIFVQNFTCCTMVNMQILLSAKPISMLEINLIVVEEGHLSHVKN
jgi:hypothetical protein